VRRVEAELLESRRPEGEEAVALRSDCERDDSGPPVATSASGRSFVVKVARTRPVRRPSERLPRGAPAKAVTGATWPGNDLVSRGSFLASSLTPLASEAGDAPLLVSGDERLPADEGAEHSHPGGAPGWTTTVRAPSAPSDR